MTYFSKLEPKIIFVAESRTRNNFYAIYSFERAFDYLEEAEEWIKEEKIKDKKVFHCNIVYRIIKYKRTDNSSYRKVSE